MKISCDIIQDLLPLYCDDACSEESRHVVEEHLTECEKCREDMRLMKEALEAPSSQTEESTDQKAAHAAASAWKKGKARAFVKGLAVSMLVVAFLACIYFAYHWFATANENNLEELSKQAADYLGYDALHIEEIEQRGNYLAVLCNDSNGTWAMCVFERDDVFENRWRAGGGKKALEAGTIGCWNYGSPNREAVLIFCGGDVPEKVCWYQFQNNKITYTCPVEDRTVVDLFIIADSDDINGYPTLLDRNQQVIE